jgi:hypothetical protein
MGRVVSQSCSRIQFSDESRTSSVAAFPIIDSIDAFEAIDISRPDDFDDGVIVLLLNDNDEPIVALAIEHAPLTNLDQIVDLLCESVHSGIDFSGVVFGMIRAVDSAPAERKGPHGNRVLWLPASAVAAWNDARNTLAGIGIAVVDIVVIEPSGWFGAATWGSQ